MIALNQIYNWKIDQQVDSETMGVARLEGILAKWEKPEFSQLSLKQLLNDDISKLPFLPSNPQKLELR